MTQKMHMHTRAGAEEEGDGEEADGKTGEEEAEVEEAEITMVAEGVGTPTKTPRNSERGMHNLAYTAQAHTPPSTHYTFPQA